MDPFFCALAAEMTAYYSKRYACQVVVAEDRIEVLRYRGEESFVVRRLGPGVLGIVTAGSERYTAVVQTDGEFAGTILMAYYPGSAYTLRAAPFKVERALHIHGLVRKLLGMPF